jgi:hypothetical protein
MTALPRLRSVEHVDDADFRLRLEEGPSEAVEHIGRSFRNLARRCDRVPVKMGTPSSSAPCTAATLPSSIDRPLRFLLDTANCQGTRLRATEETESTGSTGEFSMKLTYS